MHRSQLLSVALAVALTVTGVTFATAPALADHNADEPLLEGVFSDGGGSSSSALDKASSAYTAAASTVDGLQARGWYWISSNLGDTVPMLAGDDTTASGQAKALTTFYRANNATLETYVNTRENFTKDHTVEVTIHLDGETATRYLLANESGGNVTTSVVTSTSRTADETIELCGFAAASAHGELQHFTEEYAEPNKDVDAAYLARVKSRYGNDVETTLYPGDGSCSGGES